MKKIGIVGGVAWQSTAYYYSELCRKGEEWHSSRNIKGVLPTFEISIESLDHSKAVAYLGSDDDEASWAQFDNYHRTALQRLAASGADFALIASNTPHHRFDAIVRGISIPVLSLLTAVAKESAQIGAHRVMLLGTSMTMRSARFREEFARHGVEAAAPEDQSVRAATAELIADIQHGKTADASQRLGRIAKFSFGPNAKGRPVVCLACTELPLAFEAMKNLTSFEHDGITFVNSVAVHIDAAFNFATAE